MFGYSMKQLIRQPGKALLFFLLMAASTAMVVTGATLAAENNEQIEILEETYSTVGYIEQLPVNTESEPIPNPCMGTDFVTTTDYGEYIFPENLDFPGAEYVVKPEFCPYYVFSEPKFSGYGYDSTFHVVEFTPLEPVGEDGAPVEVEVTRVLFSVDNEYTNASVTISNTALQEGDRITVCQCFGTTRYPRRFPLCHRPPAAQWRGFVQPLHPDERRAGMVILKEKILTRE